MTGVQTCALPIWKLAERKLKRWIVDVEKIDPTAEKTTFGELLQKFEQARQGLSESTCATERGMINKLKRTWGFGLELIVSEVKPSMLDEWLAQFESELMNSSYNRYTLFLKQLFEIALADRMTTESPVEGMKRTWKKPEKPVRDIPTPERLEAIVKDIRMQRFNANAFR